jgi:polyisoprenyl-teichoic acid--peptidoglycan teichoic acid transferase
MSRAGLGLFCAAMLVALSGCGGLASGADESSPPRQAKPRATPTPQPTKPPVRVEDLLGSDGRLTVLLLGTDKRKGIVGERTDAIIVASVDPASGKVAMISLPRDTVSVPTAPGRTYADRINALFFDLQSGRGKRKAALDKVRDTLAYAFDTEIDHYALVDFDGLIRLVDAIGGVTVELKEPFIDPTMHITERGLRLKAGIQHLDGKKALSFSRSRHTSTDYDRSRRQQQVLVGAAERVAEQGADILPALVEMVRKKVVTDLPPRAAPALLELAGSVDLARPRSIVLEPVRWARQLPGSYTIAPKVVEIQKLFDRLFASG